MAGKGQGVSGPRFVRAAAPFAAALVTIVLMTVVAGAHDTDFQDPDDARGKLDVKQVRLAHAPGPPTWTIVTFGEWTTADGCGTAATS